MDRRKDGRKECTKPHVSNLVSHNERDVVELLNGRASGGGIAAAPTAGAVGRGRHEEVYFTKGDNAPILHGAGGKVRYADEVELCEGIGYAKDAFESCASATHSG
jgi:hypothetical protein